MLVLIMVIDCSQYFVAFANYHANVKVLQLLPCFPNYLYEPGPELALGLGQFPKLVAFSIIPRFFATAGFKLKKKIILTWI